MKLHLDLNALQVESFTPAGDFSMFVPPAPTYEERCTQEGATCANTCMTCPNTCLGTCDDPSCALSCTS